MRSPSAARRNDDAGRVRERPEGQVIIGGVAWFHLGRREGLRPDDGGIVKYAGRGSGFMRHERMAPFLKDGKSMLLAYDQGLEHGPSKDFDDRNIDPAFIMDIASKGGFCGVIFQKGVAERYYDGKVPLMIKLNGKSALPKGEPISSQVCSVEQAVSLGAKGVGYTIYLGSGKEAKMFSEFGTIQEEAHERGLPAVAWIYPRGESVQNELEAGGRQPVGDPLGVLSADHQESVEAELLHVLHDELRSPFLLVGVRPARQENRPSFRYDVFDVFVGEGDGVRLDQPCPPPPDSRHLIPVLLSLVHCGPDQRVDSAAVPSTAQNPDFHASSSGNQNAR